MKLFHFFLFLIISSYCYSQTKFEYIGKDPQESLFYLKVEVHNLEDNSCTFWIKEVKPTKEYNLQFGSVDCNNKTYSISQITVYNSNQKVIKSEAKYIVDRMIPPDTIVESVYNYICR